MACQRVDVNGRGRRSARGGTGPALERLVQALHGGWRNVLVGEDTVLQMLFEHEYASAFKPGTGGQELGEYIIAGTALFEHATECPDLTFNTREAVEEALIENGGGACLTG
jgi:hypothetical protein